MNRLILLLMSSLIISCSQYSPIYWSYGEWADSDFSGVENDSIAKIEWPKVPGLIRSIDGISIGKGYNKAILFPGIHIFEYYEEAVEFGPHPKGAIKIDLKPGHLYEIHLKLCYWCIPRKHTVWIDDKTTGEVVWGKRPDWPSWYL